MYKLIQRNKKLLLAIFGVVLMIAFIVPVGVNQLRPDTDSIAVGKFGDSTLTRGEVVQANRDLEALSQSRFGPLMQLGDPMGTGRVAQQLLDKPETYALLQREAQAAGVAVNEQTVDTLFSVYFQQIARKPDEIAGYRGAIRRFLLVRDHFQQVLANVKITQPIIRDSIVGRQQPTLNVVEVKADEFLAEASAPSDEKIVAHYNQYATVLPAPTSSFATTQPVQFGYRQQDKLKLQYLELPGGDLLGAAIKELKGVELLPLQRIAFDYWSANPSQFQTEPATQPSTQPATDASTAAPTTAPATMPATAPTTRPFADVRSEIQRKVLSGEINPQSAPPEDLAATMKLRIRVEERASDIRKALRDRLTKDYQEARKAAKDDKTSLSKIESVDYLEGVANDFEKEYGVRPVVKSLASDWLTVKELAALPGIGMSMADEKTFTQLATQHAQEIKPEGPEAPKTQPTAEPSTQPASTQPASTQPATAEAAGTQPAATQPAGPAAVTVESTEPAKPALALYEPSPVLVGAADSAYIFRLTAFDGAHIPKLDEVRDDIVKDLKLAEAYDLARKRANLIRDAAGSSAGNSKIGGLPVQQGDKVIKVGPVTLNNSQMPEIPGYDVSDPAVQQRFLFGLANLMRNAKADVPHPSTVIELPAQQKALVLELRSYERPWTAEEDARMQYQTITMARMGLMREAGIQEALQGWFDADAVAARMSYKALDN